MNGQPRAKSDKQSGGIQETLVPLRLFVGVTFLVIGLILYLFTN